MLAGSLSVADFANINFYSYPLLMSEYAASVYGRNIPFVPSFYWLPTQRAQTAVDSEIGQNHIRKFIILFHISGLQCSETIGTGKGAAGHSVWQRQTTSDQTEGAWLLV
jgi:hypothetical protein